MKKVMKWMLLLGMIAILSGCSSAIKKQGIDTADKVEEPEQEIVTVELEKEEPTPTLAPLPTAEPNPEVAQVEFPEKEQVITEADETPVHEKDMQLVFLGDSIFDNDRDGTGVPYLTAVQCDADVYNLAMGGTCAAVELTDQLANEEWTSASLCGVVKVIQGLVPSDVLKGYRAKEVIDSSNIDFTQTDYFIIEYGINDFLSAKPLSNSDEYFDMRTYVGALRYAVTALREVAPNAQIILCCPHYCQFYNQGWMVGDSNSLNNGYGTLRDYKGKCEYLSGELGTMFYNAYDHLGIDGYTADEYLEDGIHLTEEGRQLYADALARLINANEEQKNS